MHKTGPVNNMKTGFILKVASLIFAFVIFVICLFSVAHLVGFEAGAKWGNRPASEVMKDNVVLAVGVGPSAYEVFVASYVHIALCLCWYAVMKLVERGRALRVIAALPLIVILYKYWQLLEWKSLYLELNADFGYYYWIINSIPFDYLSAAVTAALLATQIAIVFLSYRPRDSKSL